MTFSYPALTKRENYLVAIIRLQFSWWRRTMGWSRVDAFQKLDYVRELYGKFFDWHDGKGPELDVPPCGVLGCTMTDEHTH